MLSRFSCRTGSVVLDLPLRLPSQVIEEPHSEPGGRERRDLEKLTYVLSFSRLIWGIGLRSLLGFIWLGLILLFF